MSVGYQVVADALRAQGVRQVFGLLGDGNLHAIVALAAEGEVTFTSAAHEAGGVAMADGWARATGEVGLATATHGPGLSNTLTPLIEARKHRTPMVLFAGDTARDDRSSNQSIDQHAVARAAGCPYVQPVTEDELSSAVTDAFAVARRDRVPVVLSIPVDLQRIDVAVGSREVSGGLAANVHRARHGNDTRAIDDSALDQALGALFSANNPLILAGRGAYLAGAIPNLRRLAEQVDAPVATTLLAKGAFAEDSADLGVFGTLARELCSEVAANADVIFAVGASLNGWTTLKGDLLEQRQVIHVDSNPDALHPGSVGLEGDAAQVVTAMLEAIDAAGVVVESNRRALIARRVEEQDLEAEFGWRGDGASVELQPFLATLDGLLPRQRSVVVDVGRFMRQPMRILSVPDPHALAITCNYSAVGLGVAVGIGVAVARPERRCVTVVGDGGFMMGGLTELHSAVRAGVDPIFFVLNDGAYGAEYVQLAAHGQDVTAAQFDWPSFEDVARSMGAQAITISSRAELLDASQLFSQRTDRPLVVNVPLDVDKVPNERVIHRAATSGR